MVWNKNLSVISKTIVMNNYNIHFVQYNKESLQPWTGKDWSAPIQDISVAVGWLIHLSQEASPPTALVGFSFSTTSLQPNPLFGTLVFPTLHGATQL